MCVCVCVILVEIIVSKVVIITLIDQLHVHGSEQMKLGHARHDRVDAIGRQRSIGLAVDFVVL